MNKKQNQIENQNLLIQRNNELNSLNEMNNINLIKELINSLKEKINTYEKQIRKLIDDKVKLQMDMNSIILQNLSLKKKDNSIKKNENIKEDEYSNLNKLNIRNPFDFNSNENNQEKIILSFLIEINEKLVEQNKELKSQIDIYRISIDNYKKKMMETKENMKSHKKCKFCEEKKLELNKMVLEKEEILNSIISLRKQLEDLKLNEKIKKEKKKKQRAEKIDDSLTNIEKYFIVNNKIRLFDSNNNLWHMKKCMKFQEFKKKYEQANLSSKDLLKEFVLESYEININDDSMEENENIEASNLKKKNENKYMPPLPNTNNSSNKKKNNKNNKMNNDENNEINIQININNEGKELNDNEINNKVDENDEDKKEKEITVNKI